MRTTPRRRATTFALAALAICASVATAQTERPFSENEDTHYFDFWVGSWYPVVDGRVDTTGSAFVVRRSVHAAAYEEDWGQRGDSTTGRAKAIRAWDQVTNRWMFTWISPNALFQVWEGQKFGGHWYIVREFDFEGQRFISRQSWIPDGPNRVIRTIERSTDGGRTWQVRVRGTYQKVR